jgi:hypothetical protein
VSANRHLKFYATALIGTAIGTAAGLLLAPKTGEDTRKTLRRMAGELSEQFPSMHELRLRGRQVLAGAPGLLAARRRRNNAVIQLYREKEE